MAILSDEFYYQHINLDTVNTQVFTNLTSKVGDTNGRGLIVTLTENGLQKDTTGISLNLKWKHRSVVSQGLDNFDVVDLSKGVYKITYPAEMNRSGLVDAFVQIVDSGKVVGTRNMIISVESTVGDDSAIESSNSFSALASALIEVQSWNDRIDDVEQDFIDRANNLDATYPTRLVSVEQQLADIVTTNDRPQTLGVPTTRAMYGWVDDDTVPEVYTRLKAMFDSRLAKGTLACITGTIGTAARMTLAQLQEMHADGWEILSHTHNHVNLSTYAGDEALIENELKLSKETLAGWGINAKGIVYPQNYRSEQIRRLSAKYYDFATGGIGFNGDDTTNLNIMRIAYGSWTTDNPTVNGNSDQNTLDYYKACVDYAYDNGLLLVFMSHIVAQDPSYDVMFGTLYDYITSKGCTIDSIEDCLNVHGSRIFAGDIGSEFTSIAKDGSLRFPHRTLKGAVDGVHRSRQGQDHRRTRHGAAGGRARDAGRRSAIHQEWAGQRRAGGAQPVRDRGFSDNRRRVSDRCRRFPGAGSTVSPPRSASCPGAARRAPRRGRPGPPPCR